MGLAQRIPGIVPRGPGPSLLTAASRLPAGTDWSSGVSFRQTHCFTSGRWSQCPGVNVDKPTPSGGGGVTKFFPFTAVVVAQCDWVLPTNAEGEFDPEVRAQLDAASAWHLSRELWTSGINVGGDDASPGLQRPFFGETDEFDSSHIINSGTAVNPIDAVGRLLAAYNDGTTVGGATLHVPTRLVTRLIAAYDVTLNGQVFNVPGLATVSPGPGYPGAGAYGPRVSGTPNGLVAGANEEWVYVTGPVEYDMEPITFEPDLPDARWFDRRTNQYYVEAQRKMIYRFDPCAVWAALVTVPTAS